MMEPIWKSKKVDEQSVINIADEFDLPKTIAQVMSLKGIESREYSRNFFSPDTSCLHDPFLMQDMQKSVDRLIFSINNKETILVFGDYDVDGTSSAAFLTLFFRSLDVDIHYYIPSRENEGYGVSKKGIDYAINIGANILITCDCGIVDFEEISYAKEKQLDVIITDHHKPSEKLPDAYAIINPHRKDCHYPFKGLCGAGVVFKLALAICEKAKINVDKVWIHSDIVTLGIAADLVPIIDENRIIVQKGIKKIEEGTNAGILALRRVGDLINKQITVGRLVFWVAPKINAAGRLGDASRAVKLLTTKNSVFAMEIANELEKVNNKRKEITIQIIQEAVRMVENECNLKDERIIILQRKNWHEGVNGIVASRIKEIYSRPTIIISMKDKGGKGSCRSIPGFDIVEALNECKDLLVGHGGHPMAAGLSIKNNNFLKFKDKMVNYANNNISSDKLIPIIHFDMELKLEDVNHRMIKFLNALEPYGPGNSRPIFISRNLHVDGIPKLLGRDQNTLKLFVKQDKTPFESIGFNMAEYYEKLIQNTSIDIAYIINENEWNGKKSIQLELKDIKLSGQNV